MAKRTSRNNKFGTRIYFYTGFIKRNLQNPAYGVRETHRLDILGTCRTLSTTNNPKESILPETEVETILKENPKEVIPWTITKILYKQVHNIENLQEGLDTIKNNKSAGIDGKTKRDLNNKNLKTLQKDLKSHKYKPKANR